MRTHQVSAAHFAALAAGRGDAAVVHALRAAQLSKRLLQLRALLDEAGQAGAEARMDAGYQLLTAAQRHCPVSVTAVLAEPHVGAWLAHSLRRLRGSATGDQPLAVDLAHLAAIAAAAAARAGLDFSTELPCRGGTVTLPTYGRALVGEDRRWVPVSSAAGVLTVAGAQIPTAGQAGPPESTHSTWDGLRALTATAGDLSIRVTLDDLDPFRDVHRLSAADRLAPAGMRQWQQRFAEGWQLLVGHHRGYAEAMAAGLRTLVPLAAQRSTRGVNATSMDAFGAVSLSPPADGLAFAVALVHEFQHAKLGALMDLVPLHEPADTGRYYAPWRDDARPLGGLLHGAYAFLGVADFWRVQRDLLGPELSRFAHFEFARWRERVSRVLDVLRSSGRLTPAGLRFVAGLRATLAPWWDEHVPTEPAELAHSAAEDHRVGWRLRNLRPQPDRVRALAAAWLDGAAAPDGGVPTDILDRDRALVHNVRLDLTCLRITDPERFARLCGDPVALAGEVPEATAGDAAYARAEYPEAVIRYRKEIAADPDAVEPWTGLTLAQRGTRRGRPSALLTVPEVVYAVHREARASSGVYPDPEELADWLAGLTATTGP